MSDTATGITGKVVVTGASSGLGEATTRCLAERGATVVLGINEILFRPTRQEL
jgi:NADP-dependent 3-hydroxy acid dehydrogenase YdfG